MWRGKAGLKVIGGQRIFAKVEKIRRDDFLELAA